MNYIFPRSIRPEVPEFMEEGEIKQVLRQMKMDSSMETDQPSQIPFVKKHLTYLKEHPKVNPEHYLSNLRTMVKKRP